MDIVEVLQNLTDDQKDRYMKLERLLESDGWLLIKEWLESQALVAKDRVTFANTWEENRRAFGNMEVYYQLANLAEEVENQFTALAQDNKYSKEVPADFDEIEYE